VSDSTTVTSGQPVTGSASAPHAGPSAAADKVASQMSDRPELAIGGAFAGGLLAALILKRLVR
jgi:hypothetical protein